MVKRNFFLILVLFYILTVIYGSLFNLNNVTVINFKFYDKTIHFLTYFVLCLLVFITFSIYKFSYSLQLSIIFSIIFGVVIEFLQMKLTTNRNFDSFDILANLVGVLLMSIFIQKNKNSLLKISKHLCN
ncbi:MAG: hypothetical protein CMC83_03685 [Flavobacteriaceae bacterium]|nr:hypothetical protein [Flavobacteriaceae bacterium]